MKGTFEPDGPLWEPVKRNVLPDLHRFVIDRREDGMPVYLVIAGEKNGPDIRSA